MHYRFLLSAMLLAACQTYEPAPVDLAEHARAVELRHAPPTSREIDVTDGITLDEGRRLALLYNSDCQLARLRAGVASASAVHAGEWDDPVFAADIARILESLPHQWLVGGAFEFTLPLFGRKNREKELADRGASREVLAAWIAEQETFLAVDRAWITWSTAHDRVAAGKDMLQRIEGLEAIATRLGTAGELSRPEVRVFHLERVSRANELRMAETALAEAAAALKRLLGLHPRAPAVFTPISHLDPDRRPAQTVEEFEQSPRGVALRMDHAYREAQLDLEIARQWPDLMLGPGWSEEDAQPRLTLGIALPLPLWNRNAGAIATARAERDYTAAALRLGLEQFFHDVAQAERRLDAATERRERIERDLVPLANQQLEDSRALAERGTLEPLLLLDALARAHRARLDAIDAVLAQSLRAADLTALTWIDFLRGRFQP